MMTLSLPEIDRTAHQTLEGVYTQLQGDSQGAIPLLVRLLENPESPVALPGKINLRNHDYLHILLNRGQSAQDEAFVVGFTMGNDPQANSFHVGLFKFFARFLYPKVYRFSLEHLKIFDLGFRYGRRLKTKHLNLFDFESCQHQTVAVLRKELGIDEEEIQLLRDFETWLLNYSKHF
jgi:hypothetical protein